MQINLLVLSVNQILLVSSTIAIPYLIPYLNFVTILRFTRGLPKFTLAHLSLNNIQIVRPTIL